MTGTKVVKLKLEDGGAERLPHLKESAVSKSLEVYKKTENMSLSDHMLMLDYHETVSKESKGLDLTSAEIQELSDLLEDSASVGLSHPFRRGIFLSALIQSSSQKKFRLKTKTLLHCIGYMLNDKEKKITVEGDAGDYTGQHMNAGQVSITGNAGDFTGWSMSGGSIKIEKDARNNLAAFMSNGIILVKGNARDYAGQEMVGGRLHIGGTARNYLGNSVKSNATIRVEKDIGDHAALMMSGGTIEVKGKAGKYLGSHMVGGTVKVAKGIEEISKDFQDGSIQEKGEWVR
ncbi:MAG: hypothetical protein V1921_06415 [Candidatus Altiarchaeota archaeon]